MTDSDTRAAQKLTGSSAFSRNVRPGIKVADLTRKYAVSEQSIYRWQAKYGGMEVSEAKRLRQLEEENARLKRMVADLSLDKQMLEDVLSKKWWGLQPKEPLQAI